MNLDVEVVESPATYEGMLVFVAAWRLGLAKTMHEAVVLQSNGAILLNGVAVTDLNTRLPRVATLIVGLHGVQLG